MGEWGAARAIHEHHHDPQTRGTEPATAQGLAPRDGRVTGLREPVPGTGVRGGDRPAPRRGAGGGPARGRRGRRLPPVRAQRLRGRPGHRTRSLRRPGPRAPARSHLGHPGTAAGLRSFRLRVRPPRRGAEALRGIRHGDVRLTGHRPEGRRRRRLRGVAARRVPGAGQDDAEEGTPAGARPRRDAVRLRRARSGGAAHADAVEVRPVPQDRADGPVRAAVDRGARGAAVPGPRGALHRGAVRGVRGGPAGGRALRAAVAHGVRAVVHRVRPRPPVLLARPDHAPAHGRGRRPGRCAAHGPGARRQGVEGLAQDPRTARRRGLRGPPPPGGHGTPAVAQAGAWPAEHGPGPPAAAGTGRPAAEDGRHAAHDGPYGLRHGHGHGHGHGLRHCSATERERAGPAAPRRER